MFLRDITLATFAPLPAFFAVAVEASKLVAVRKFHVGGNARLALSLCDPMPIDAQAQHAVPRSPLPRTTSGSQKPSVEQCTGEVDYGNAGVMLLHVERMRRTHAEFVRFIFSDEVVEAGMDHGVYGPADQGAYNRFFAGYFDVHLEASWNWKPYWGHAANVSLVHFHGPKPHEYFAHERRSNNSNHTDREYNNFVEIFNRCDELDRENAALMPPQPGGCMAYSHRYREELTKVLQVEGDRPTSNYSFVPKWLRSVFG